MADGLEILGKISEHFPDGRSRASRTGVESTIAELPSRRLEGEHENRQQRGLARAVRTEQPEHAFSQGEIHSAQGLVPVRVRLGDAAYLDELWHGVLVR